jgi:lipoprotein-releasing system permease protein
MALGVACLVIAMAIVSGYESTLKNALIDSFGHLVLVKRGEPLNDYKDVATQVQASDSRVRAITPFLFVEAIAAKSGKIQGVLLEGVDEATHAGVVNMQSRIQRGEFKFGLDEDDRPYVSIGKELAKRLNIEPGDVMKVVVPVTKKWGGDRFRPRAISLKVSGILDLGRYDFDERYMLMDLGALQKFAKLKSKVTGLRVRLNSSENANEVGAGLVNELGFPYWYRTWRDSNQNLFDAIDYEKPVIFLIVALIVLAAAFNIAGSLYVSVLRRYRDISVLKTLGADQKFIRKLFSTQGLIIGLIGALLGLAVGVWASGLLVELQNSFQLFPGEVYRIDRVDLEVRHTDLLIILMVSMVICYLASLAPARRGGRLNAVEGLRYE